MEFSKGEAYQRSATGRLYYACFNMARRYYKNKYSPLNNINAHNKLIKNLKSKNNIQEKNISKLLYQLRIKRNCADYDDVFDMNDIKHSVRLADEIIYLLEDLNSSEKDYKT